MPSQIQTQSQKAGEFTFGVEIECFVPQSCPIRVGGHASGIQLPPDFPAGWEAQYDSSLATSKRGMKSVEIVSPILKGRSGLMELLEVAKKLNVMGAIVNRTCGFHVHVGAKSVAGELADGVAGWVSNLIHLMGQHELALYASTGSRFRATACRYTGSIKAEYGKKKRDEIKKKKWDVMTREITGIDRYRTLNVQNLLNGRMTVEFRVFAGTLCPEKILGHVQMALGLCEKALGPAVPFDAPQTTIYRGGDGLRSLERLFYLLGWNLGRKDVGKPECSALGWISELEPIGEVKKELRRLAKKFDTDTES